MANSSSLLLWIALGLLGYLACTYIIDAGLVLYILFFLTVAAAIPILTLCGIFVGLALAAVSLDEFSKPELSKKGQPSKKNQHKKRNLVSFKLD